MQEWILVEDVSRIQSWERGLGGEGWEILMISLFGYEMVYTRYFVFSKVAPTPDDYSFFVDTCAKINAFFGYRTIVRGSRRELRGFIVLRGNRSSDRPIQREFPNFLVRTVDIGFDFSLGNAPDDMVFGGGDHPYDDVKRSLFGDGSLRSFLLDL